MSLAPVPPLPDPAHSPETRGVLAAIESLSTTLAVARALVGAGREVELDGLEQEAARLCLALGCMAEGSAAVLRPPLLELAQELERLDTALRLA
jgi:hypothetical protein